MPVLVIRTAAVKPVFHSLVTTYWHLLAAALELDELRELEVEVATDEEVDTTELELLVFALEVLEGVDELVLTLELVEVLTTLELVVAELELVPQALVTTP